MVHIGSYKFHKALSYIDYLDSINTILWHGRWNKSYDIQVKNLLLSINAHPSRKIRDEAVIDKILENLKSSWLNELSLIHSLEYSKLKFAHWDIAKFYYTIYPCVSAMSRIPCPYINEKKHYEKIRAFNNNILRSPNYSNFIIPPLNVIYEKNMIPDPKNITGWEYGQTCHCARIEECLKSMKENKRNREFVSILDFLKEFREWANYNGTHLMTYFYGESPKSKLSSALENISLGFEIIAENFIIKFTDFKHVLKAFEEFETSAKSNLELDVSRIQKRFDIYSEK